MQRKWLMLAASAVIGATVLTGCTARQGDLGNKSYKQNSIRYDMNGNRIMNKRFADDQMNEMNRVEGRRLNSNNIIGSHANYRLEMSQEIADRLAAMKEIDKAYVMLTDNNAYVAVSLADSTRGKGTNMMSATPARPISRTNQAFMRPGMVANGVNSLMKQGRDKLGLHYNSIHLNNGMTPDRMRLNYPAPTMNNANYKAESMYRSYNVPGTGVSPLRTTAPARHDVAVSNDIKDRIAHEVKRMSPQIQNVYVSANPDFIARMTSYMEDVRLGHPIQGFIAEFNAMVERIFPARSGVK